SQVQVCCCCTRATGHAKLGMNWPGKWRRLESTRLHSTCADMAKAAAQLLTGRPTLATLTQRFSTWFLSQESSARSSAWGEPGGSASTGLSKWRVNILRR